MLFCTENIRHYFFNPHIFNNIGDINYKEFYENSPDMHISVSTIGLIVSCNQTLVNKIGYKKSEIIGKHITDLYHPNSKVKTTENFESLLKGDPVIHNELIALKRMDALLMWL